MKTLILVLAVVAAVHADGGKQPEKRGILNNAALGDIASLGHNNIASLGLNDYRLNDNLGTIRVADGPGYTVSEVNRHVPYAVPQPYPVTINRPYPVAVPQPVPVSVPRPYPVAVPQPIPVNVPRPVPVDVPRAVPYAVPHAVPYAVTRPVAIPVPQPYEVSVPVAQPVAVAPLSSYYRPSGALLYNGGANLGLYGLGHQYGGHLATANLGYHGYNGYLSGAHGYQASSLGLGHGYNGYYSGAQGYRGLGHGYNGYLAGSHGYRALNLGPAQYGFLPSTHFSKASNLGLYGHGHYHHG